MNLYMSTAVVMVVGLGLWTGGLRAQQGPGPESLPLSLSQAEEMALEGNPDLRIAAARARAAREGSRIAGSFIWPVVGAEAGTVRSNDPVAAFGTRLRQGRFSEADFAIDALNSPDPITDWTAAVGGEWSVLDPARWAGRDVASLQADAAELGLERREEATLFQTRVLYFQALQAQARLDAAVTAEEAASATADLFAARRERGLMTDADLYQAEAELAGAAARRIHAEQMTQDARSRLGIFLGLPAGRLPVPVDRLLREISEVEPVALHLESRGDLMALDRMAKAAEARVSQANRSWLPSLQAFGRLSAHGHEAFGSREGSWTVGMQLSWPVFTGFARRSAVRAAREEERAARLERDRAVTRARAEVAEATRGVRSALGQVEATEAASRAADEARRLMERRFQEGMATAVDLLQAEARAVDMRTRSIDARASYLIAVARLELVGS
jgi:outer membrane protein TolC